MRVRAGKSGNGVESGRGRIVIVGAGIGGLAAAAFLHRAGLPAKVYEQAGVLTEVGAGLVVAPNAARLLRRLPAATRLEDTGVALETGWEFRRWADGRVLFAQQLGDVCIRRYGDHTWTMHRADLLDVLASAVPPDAIKLRRQCTGATQDSDGVTLTRLRLPRASRVQEASRGRTAHHHLPDGPEQRARDAAFAAEDPLSHNDWIYGYDAEHEAAAAA